MMPEIKNTLLKSKMNKDLDSRIIPNGEYRDAKNVSVSTSEGADVGALENILGNIEVADFGLTDLNLEIIGHCTDVSSNRIFFFITFIFYATFIPFGSFEVQVIEVVQTLNSFNLFRSRTTVELHEKLKYGSVSVPDVRDRCIHHMRNQKSSSSPPFFLWPYQKLTWMEPSKSNRVFPRVD